MLLLQRLHPGNFPLALAWSFFAPVRYWRAEYLPKGWLGRFRPLDPAELFDFDQWQQSTEDAFDSWKNFTASRSNVPSPSTKIAGQEIDFDRYWIQWLALRFEERSIFLDMVQREGARLSELSVGVAGNLVDVVRELKNHLPRELVATGFSKVFRYLDVAWLGFLALIKSAKYLAALFRATHPTPRKKCAILWTGISPVEVPEGDLKLSFYFMIERGLMHPDSCLYVLPRAPNPEAISRLERFGVRWTSVSSFAFLSTRSKLAATRDIVVNLAKALLFCLLDIRRAVVAVAAIEAVPWVYAAKDLGADTYLNTVSNCWPEPAEVCALKALGVRTINWSYGANTFWYSRQYSNLRDVAVARSSTCSDEIWIWSSPVERLLSFRSLEARGPVYRVIGEVMCGDSSWLGQPPATARRALGIQTSEQHAIVSVFDVPPVTTAMRLSIGQGPSIYPIEVLDRFFSDLENLLSAVPTIRLLIKPKRSLSDPMRDYSSAMHRILDPDSALSRAGRILLVPHDIDPYLPVAVADICIGVPFTSPVMAAIGSGRTGLFYDPLRRASYAPNAPHLSQFLCHDPEDLRRRVIDAIGSYAPSGVAWVDPGERFARFVLPEERSVTPVLKGIES